MDASSWSRANPASAKRASLTDFAGLVRETGGLVLEARAYAGEAAIALAPISELIRVGLDRPGAEFRLRRVRAGASGGGRRGSSRCPPGHGA